MLNGNGYSLSDIASVVSNENGFGTNSWWVIILFLIWGNYGFGGNNWNRGGFGPCGGSPATTEDVQNQFNFSALERQNNEIVDAVRQTGYDVTGSVKDMGYMNNNSIRDIESMVQANGYELQKGFCNLAQAIDAVKYDNAINTREIMKNDCDNTQKILDAIATNRMADMQNQINQLQLQSALCGVMRFPQATTYTAGPAPYFGGQCGCQCNNY